MQDSFVHAFLQIPKFDEKKGEFKFWFRKLIVNKTLMHLRKKKNLKYLKTVDIDEVKEYSSSEMSQLDRLSLDELLELINAMPENYRMVFNMNILDGYNHQEISVALEITEQNSRIRLNRAKEWLRKTIGSSKKFNGLWILRNTRIYSKIKSTILSTKCPLD